MDKAARIAAVVVAAGRGSRAGGTLPKQYQGLAGQSLLARTVSAIAAAETIGRIAVVIHPDDAGHYAAASDSLSGAILARLMAPVFGARSRQASVHAGLEALAAAGAPRLVLIHDAARPFVSAALIRRAIDAAQQHGAAIPAITVTDSVKSLAIDGTCGAAVPRETLRMVQTPQAFDFELILTAHRRAAQGGPADLSDDAAVAEWAGNTVHFFAGERDNMKVTEAEDFARSEAQIANACGDIRIGQGYDVHAFEPGGHVILGGIRIAHDRKLRGHSDADVVLHAITDAILGALADGDIGAHFPPSDPKWRGASSDIFLKDACSRVAARGGFIAHLDVTIVCEAPKIGPHRDAMRAKIADVTGLAIGHVAVKATTSEELGFTGRREGIAASAVATVRLPWGRGDV